MTEPDVPAPDTDSWALTRRFWWAAGVAALVAVVGLSVWTGFLKGQLDDYPPKSGIGPLVHPDFTNAAAGDVLVRDVVLVKSPGQPDAALVGTFISSGAPDRLTGVSVVPAGSGTPVSVPADLALPTHQAVPVGSGGDNNIRIPDLTGPRGATLGTYAKVTFTFADAGPLTVNVLVTDLDYLATLAPTPTPTPTPTITP
jgi:hypothetical protein